MPNRPNHYQVLHVQPDAPDALIRASYRTLMQNLRMHPDLGGSHEQAVLINEAFATLSHADRRAAYDRTLAAKAAAASSARRAATSTAQSTSASHSPTADEVTAPGPPRATRHPRPCGFCGAPSAAVLVESPDSVCHACDSALFPARKHQVGESSRRAIDRLPRHMPLTFRRSPTRPAATGTTEDVSLHGACFTSTTEVHVGDLLSLECEFCSAVAHVKNVRMSGRPGSRVLQVGVEFLTLRIKHTRGGLVSTVA